MNTVGLPEFMDNPEDRCPVVLLLDISGSMDGEPLEKINIAIKEFKSALCLDDFARLRVEVSTVTFGSTVNVRQDFVSPEQFDDSDLTSQGRTPTGEAILKGFDLLESRKHQYKANNIKYYRPWIVMITDGAPTDDWQEAANTIQVYENSKKSLFWTIGVEGADMNTLAKIAPTQKPPVMLEGYKFSELFLWLSSSISAVSASQQNEQIALPPPTAWMKTET